MGILAVNELVDPRIALSLNSPLSFDVLKGESLYICGRNGAGKTTLLRMIADLESPQSGRINKTSSLFFCGHQTGMKGSLSVWDNLKFRTSLYGNDSEKQINITLALFGLDKKRDYLLEMLSLGQQRLVAMISAILSPHLLWVLDEPFAHLDAQAETLLEAALQSHLQKGGAVILSSHEAIKGQKTVLL